MDPQTSWRYGVRYFLKQGIWVDVVLQHRDLAKTTNKALSVLSVIDSYKEVEVVIHVLADDKGAWFRFDQRLVEDYLLIINFELALAVLGCHQHEIPLTKQQDKLAGVVFAPEVGLEERAHRVTLEAVDILGLKYHALHVVVVELHQYHILIDVPGVLV